MTRPFPLRPHLPALLSLLTVLLFTACGGEGGGGNTPTQVDPSRATSIVLSSTAVSLEAIGATHQLSATVKDQDGHVMSGTSITWSSSNDAVAVVVGAGSVTAVSVGTATISASAGTLTVSATVSVTQTAREVSIAAPAETVLDIGETVQYGAEVRDANGHAIPGATVSWSSSDPDCVQIDQDTGLATAVGFGAVSISATAGSLSSSANLEVIHIPSSEAELLSFSIEASKNPAFSSDAVGEIDGGEVVILVSGEVGAKSMIPTFTVSSGATVEIDGVEQLSGVTEADLTKVLRYTVVAEDQSRNTYAVYLGRILEAGEVVGWQRDSGWFRYLSDPRDITLLEPARLHLDSLFGQIADTLHATLTDTISLQIYPSKAALHDKLRELGENPPEWWLGVSIRTDSILVSSPNSPDLDMSLDDFLSMITHESTHSVVAMVAGEDVRVPRWLNEGLAVLEKDLVSTCFPDCSYDWTWQKEVVEMQGKPDLETLFDDPSVGYGFCSTTGLFIVKRYGWATLQTFLSDPFDYSPFGMSGSNEFEAHWYGFLDELFGLEVPIQTMAEARAQGTGPVTVEGRVTWQTQWDDRIYFLQDETAGISTFHPEGAIPLSEGDRIRITGEVSSYRGELQINPITQISVQGIGEVPAARVVTGAEVNGGQFQGELVEVIGTVQDLQELSYGNQRVTIRDSSGTDFPVYVDSRMGMIAGDWPAVGTKVKVVGVLGTDDRSGVPEGTGPRVEVRKKEDVTLP